MSHTSVIILIVLSLWVGYDLGKEQIEKRFEFHCENTDCYCEDVSFPKYIDGVVVENVTALLCYHYYYPDEQYKDIKYDHNLELR